MGDERNKIRRRSYLPKVEALEALRLMDAAAPSFLPVAILLAPETPAIPPVVEAGHDAWDAALEATHFEELVAGPRIVITADPDRMALGLSQLDRYLGRSWARAGLSAQAHDDCTQAVYTSLLQTWGRPTFDQLLAEVGNFGIRETLTRETMKGPEFFRAIDTVKKRAQREKSYAPLDDGAQVASGGNDQAEAWKGALYEAIASSLNPREAALIRATLKGESPAEIAQQWGVAPKTVSNEKTRAIQKLREALVADLSD